MKKITLTIIVMFLIVCNSGCEKVGRVSRLSVEYGSSSYTYHPDNHLISYIRNRLPYKTYLTIINPSNKKSESYHFNDYGFYGMHDIAPELNLGVACAKDTHIGMLGSDILLFDLSKQKIIKTFNVPVGYTATILHQPKWSGRLFVLLQTDNGAKAFIKTINLSDYTETTPEVLGNFVVNDAIIHDTKPLLILDVVEADKNKLIVYDMKNKSIYNSYSTKEPFTALKIVGNEIYGLLRLPGNDKGQLRAYSLDENKENMLCEINGIPESILFVKDSIYVIATDPQRSNLQQKNWLYPRNLYVYDLNKHSMKNAINWTMRRGSLFGFDDKTNKLFFAVIDNDAPSIWFIDNDNDTLSKINRIIN